LGLNFLLRLASSYPNCTEPTKESHISDPRTNDRIRVPEVRLVGPNGEQVGVVRIEEAIRLAQEADLDLVEVAPNSKPPVAKIMDFGKFKYETAQKAKEAKRNQSNTILKEVRFRLKIDVHDYETKRKRAEGFLQGGDKVKAMILFRGREQSRPEQGVRLLQRFAEDVSEFGTIESTPMIDGRNMVMVIGPLKTKAEVKAEHDAKKPVQRERVERPAGELKTEPAAGASTTSGVAAEKLTSVKSAATAPLIEATFTRRTAVEVPVAKATPVVRAVPVVKSEPPAVRKDSAATAESSAKIEPSAAKISAGVAVPAAAPAKSNIAPQPVVAVKQAVLPKPNATSAPKPGVAPKPRAATKTAPADVTTD